MESKEITYSVDFKYDVAFSFTQKDEELANSLFLLLKDRLSCFIYSEEQKKLAGGNGEDLFNSVFSKESRIVVILLRQEYGNTKWTRIEETAIRNRGFEEGYDFVILIPTENHIPPPKWLPKNRLWIGLERWGVDTAAGVIEARVQEFGGNVKVETIADKAAKIENEFLEKNKREFLLNSLEVVSLVNEELNKLKGLFKKQVEDINSSTKNWKITFRENNMGGVDILSNGFMLSFHYYDNSNNSLSSSYLYLLIAKGYSDENGNYTSYHMDHKLLYKSELRFDINNLNQNGWSNRETRENFITSKKLVDFMFEKFMPHPTSALR